MSEAFEIVKTGIDFFCNHLVFFNMLFAIVIVFFQRRDPKSVWAWLLLLYFIPVLQYTKEDIINNPNITFDSAIQKLYFAISDKYKDVKIYQRTNPDTKEPYIKLIFPERENGRIEAFVTNDDTSIKHIASDEMRKINFSECFFHYEEESKVISDVQNIQNIIREKAKENIKESIKETDIACQKAHKGDEAR